MAEFCRVILSENPTLILFPFPLYLLSFFLSFFPNERESACACARASSFSRWYWLNGRRSWGFIIGHQMRGCPVHNSAPQKKSRYKTTIIPGQPICWSIINWIDRNIVRSPRNLYPGANRHVELQWASRSQFLTVSRRPQHHSIALRSSTTTTRWLVQHRCWAGALHQRRVPGFWRHEHTPHLRTSRGGSITVPERCRG